MARPGGNSDCEVLWLSCGVSDLPPSPDWLGPRESEILAELRVPKRRRDWTLGRWTAKQALVASRLADPHTPLAALEILPAPDGAPELVLGGRRALCLISLSHAADTALCSVSSDALALGSDIESVESRDPGLVGDYFTESETADLAAAPAGDRTLLTNLIWSAKESALKAAREGLRRDTRSVEVQADWSRRTASWNPLLVRCLPTGIVYHGWWYFDGHFARTIVTRPGCSLPIPLASRMAAAIRIRESNSPALPRPAMQTSVGTAGSAPAGKAS